MDRKVKKAVIKICPEAKKAFKDGKDVYAFLASIMFSVSDEECCPFDKIMLDGYKTFEEWNFIGDRYRKIAKSFVLFKLYPTVGLMQDINSLYKEVIDYKRITRML